MKKNAAVVEVRVSLKEGLTILALKPGNATTVAELRQIIKNNGFVSRDVTATAQGSVSADQRSFVVGGTNELLSLAIPAQKKGDDWVIVVPPPARR